MMGKDKPFYSNVENYFGNWIYLQIAQEDSWVCWNCCKKIPTDTQKMRYY